VLDWSGDWEFSPDEYGVGFTSDIGECVCSQVSSGADHVVESHKECSPLTHQPMSCEVRNGLTARENNRVQRKAPMNPSTVFLGDNLINGVRPNIFPQTYAMTSLQMTKDAGTKNQIIPSRILLTIKWLETTIRNKLMWTQQNRANCCRRCAFFRLATNPTKPGYQLELYTPRWYHLPTV
jgi:hypothetical protein